MDEIQIVTLPRIYDGTPWVTIFVGIPAARLGGQLCILDHFRSNRLFLGERLHWDWGYPSTHEYINLPAGVLAPENYRWHKTSVTLSGWEEIPSKVEEILQPLRGIKVSNDHLISTMPGMECRFISL